LFCLSAVATGWFANAFQGNITRTVYFIQSLLWKETPSTQQEIPMMRYRGKLAGLPDAPQVINKEGEE
jgi:hypothetical protein